MRRELREIVTRMVEEVLDEAFGRERFISDLRDIMFGALGEHYKACWAKENGLATQQDLTHWAKEVAQHLDAPFARALLRKEKGFKRAEAFEEALSDLEDDADIKWRWSKGQIAKKFEVDPKGLAPFDRDAADASFEDLVRLAYATALGI